MKIKIGEHILTVDLVNNSTTVELKNRLKKGPITLNMKDYGNMEKVGDFDKSLPTNDEQISTDAGDVILYQGKSFVIYYDKNNWNFTRIGKVKNISKEELRKILGKGDIKVELYLE
ncbi:cyclophilin-like fold protein [Fusobacterium simiae]|uniref:Cyclophilin-like fold protein n=1 Tax=Fusobacterium simiae TaxID=855 RepID=A0ABT4DJT7_FUSSI|nr:cyclophilin-like fold protein [Fusobacterium simiae]MCY7008861.1 cyclophilin-like fold protein [Fusobacterium simiae]